MADDLLLEIADELYALTPGEFTAARDAVARQHRTDRELAARVKKLRRPSLAAWVVNLLVRREADQVSQVLAVGAALREAQEGMDAAQLRELTKQRRTLTRAVAGRARGLAADQGQRLTDAVLDQVEATLTAAMVDEGAAGAVRSGLLVQALAATGVDAVDLAPALAVPEALGFLASPREEQPSARPGLHVVPDPHADAKALTEARARLADAEETLAARRGELAEAGEQVQTWEAESLRVQGEIDELRRRLAALEAELEQTEDDLAEAEEARDLVRADVEEAETDRDRAAAVVDRLSPQG